MPKRTDIQSILIIGAGPIIIGQACEFDYSGAQACKALREEGYRVILVNSNPATIMTDPETADVTYIPTGEGWLYLAAVEDLYSRKIVGWSMSERMESRLVVDALEMAIQRELPGEGLTAHSDRGVQYASEHYQALLKKHAVTCSMSRKGNCWDNAPMESFFGTLKKELVHHEEYRTRAEARRSLFEYIETFYNRTRRHSTLGYVSPEQFEQAV